MIELRLVHHCTVGLLEVRSNDVGSSIMRNVRSQDVTKKQKKCPILKRRKKLHQK